MRNTKYTVSGLCIAKNYGSHDILASYKNQIDYLLSKIYFLREGKKIVIKEFVNITKKYANIDTSDKDKHDNITQEKYDSVTSSRKSPHNPINIMKPMSQIIKKSNIMK